MVVLKTVTQPVGGNPPSPGQTVSWTPGDNLLTPRESEVMRWLARGKLNKEIAEELGISFSAVHKHQYNIFRKLHVDNRTEAAVKWMSAIPEV